MEVGVKEVATQLGVTEARVRQLIAAGDMPARQVSGRWLVPEGAVPRSLRVSRPMSERMAWAFIDLLSGRPVTGVVPTERYRLLDKRHQLLGSPRPGVLLRSWLRRRAGLLRLEAPAGDIAELLADPRLVPSGISDPRSAMSAGNGAEGYVRRSDVEALMRDYLMAESAEGNVWLHTADRSLLRPPPLGLVIADLADHDGPREDGVIEALLRSVPT
jgi:excisionase family DNA binding protein